MWIFTRRIGVYRVSGYPYAVKEIMDNAKSDGFTVYPNPFNGVFNIDGAEESAYSLHLEDIHGRVIGVKRDGATVSLPDNCASGIYILRIKTANKVFIKKITYLK
jgi:hypothetical protein